MSRRFSKLLIALVLAWHGFIVLGGPCLHALPGAGHHARSGSERSMPLGDSPDSCVICHFIAQGQLAAEMVHEPLPEGVAAHTAVEPRIDSHRPALHRPSPRAPPAA